MKIRLGVELTLVLAWDDKCLDIVLFPGHQVAETSQALRRVDSMCSWHGRRESVCESRSIGFSVPPPLKSAGLFRFCICLVWLRYAKISPKVTTPILSYESYPIQARLAYGTNHVQRMARWPR